MFFRYADSNILIFKGIFGVQILLNWIFKGINCLSKYTSLFQLFVDTAFLLGCKYLFLILRVKHMFSHVVIKVGA
jgi:hypothetical protein